MPYFAPASQEEALAILRDKAPKVVAGCTDFFPAEKPGERVESLLDLSRVDGLRGIERTEEGWRIGAMTTWTDVIRHPLPAAFDGLKAAAREVGSVQIQNRGTLAGNICNASPAADGVPPLLTLEAVVEIASFQGVRQVRLSRFITGVRQIDLGEDEIVTALMIPPVAESAGSGFVKLGSRRHLVISIAMVSALVELDAGRISDLRLAVGSCSPVAKRLTQLEQKLTGMTPEEACNAELSADLFAPLSPISDVRGSADYRAEAVPELCRRALQKAVEGAS